jgi:hypothetical protein
MADPTRPGEIPHEVRPAELVERQQRHVDALFDHRYGLAHLTDQQRARHCLAQLAYAAALAQRALHGRWIVATDALGAGAGHEQVAAAMGLDLAELHSGLRAWAQGQLRYEHITADRHAQVLALLGEQAGEAPDPGARGAER